MPGKGVRISRNTTRTVLSRKGDLLPTKIAGVAKRFLMGSIIRIMKPGKIVVNGNRIGFSSRRLDRVGNLPDSRTVIVTGDSHDIIVRHSR